MFRFKEIKISATDDITAQSQADIHNYNIIVRAKNNGFGVGFGYDPFGDSEWLAITAQDAYEYSANLSS